MKRLTLLALSLVLASCGVFCLGLKSRYQIETVLFLVNYVILLIGQAHVPMLKRLYPIWLSKFLAASGYGAIPVLLSRLKDFRSPSHGIMMAASGSLFPMLVFYGVFLCVALICVRIWYSDYRDREKRLHEDKRRQQQMLRTLRSQNKTKSPAAQKSNAPVGESSR